MSVATREAETLQQLAAMSCDRVDLGALNQVGHMMLGESVNVRLIPSALRWLRRENARGAHIFIRPAGNARLSFSLLDDLSAESIAEMKGVGFEPSIVVETSPDNFQAWLKHGRALDRSIAKRAAQELARRFHGDPSSVGWRHFGRLAGFTNQKPHRRLPNGQQPFVILREAAGQTYRKADQFLDEVTGLVQRELAARRVDKRVTERTNCHFIKPLSRFHEDPRYGGDLHRADLAWAIYAASRGLSEERIRDAILFARDLSKKGRRGRQLDYAERTAHKAITVVQPTR